MRRFRIALAGLAMAAASLVPVAAASAATPAPAPATATVHAVPQVTRGCPRGDVCMYTINGWNASRPEHKYFRYACYPVHEDGHRVVFNHQTHHALVSLYRSSNCTGTPVTTIPAGHAKEGPIHEIKSLKLYP